MTEEQKAKTDLLKTLFLDGAITASEFEKRKEDILAATPTPEVAQAIPQKSPVEEGESKPLPPWVLGTGILIIGFIIILATVQNNWEKNFPGKPAIEKFKELTPAQQDSILKRDREIALKREAADKERREKEAAEEKAFLKTKAGKIWNKHRDWSKEDCALLAQGKYWVGMHVDMLKYRRGLPNSANPSNYGNGTSWQWCWSDYTPSCFYDNNNDGLIDAYN